MLGLKSVSSIAALLQLAERDTVSPILISQTTTELLTSLNRRTMKRLEQDGRFPKPVPLSDGRVGYVLSEVLAWNVERIAERHGHANPPSDQHETSDTETAAKAAATVQPAHPVRVAPVASKRALTTRAARGRANRGSVHAGR